jgi:NADH-quinone oxidoreductase subunit E
MKFNEEQLKEAQRLISRYPEGRQKSALLPLLHLAQDNNNNWLDTAAMDYVAELLKITKIEVYEVASFYSMFNLKPVGKYVFEFCQTGPCNIQGVKDVIKYTEKKLGVKEGEVTPDGLFSWKRVECLGACGYAPMMQLGEHYKEHLTPEKIDAIVDEYRKKSGSLN